MRFENPSTGPKPVGHYSICSVLPNGFVFLSGQIAIDPETNSIKGETVFEQTRIILQNISKILFELGYSIENIFKVNVYIRDIAKFGEFDKVYSEFLGNHKPVRTTVEVSNLPKNALIEIEVAAYKV